MCISISDGSLGGIKFRVMIIRILNSKKKYVETIKKDKSEIKNAIYEIIH